MAKAILTVNGESVQSFSDTKPTDVTYAETPKIPEVHQRAFPIRPVGDHVPAKGIREPVVVPEDRGFLADPNLPNLFSSKEVQRIDLTPSIGTLIKGLQLASLTDAQKDELALLVEHRGVVFFRDQDLSAEQQRGLFDYYGKSEPPRGSRMCINCNSLPGIHLLMGV